MLLQIKVQQGTERGFRLLIMLSTWKGRHNHCCTCSIQRWLYLPCSSQQPGCLESEMCLRSRRTGETFLSCACWICQAAFHARALCFLWACGKGTAHVCCTQASKGAASLSATNMSCAFVMQLPWCLYSCTAFSCPIPADCKQSLERLPLKKKEKEAATRHQHF